MWDRNTSIPMDPVFGVWFGVSCTFSGDLWIGVKVGGSCSVPVVVHACSFPHRCEAYSISLRGRNHPKSTKIHRKSSKIHRNWEANSRIQRSFSWHFRHAAWKCWKNHTTPGPAECLSGELPMASNSYGINKQCFSRWPRRFIGIWLVSGG